MKKKKNILVLALSMFVGLFACNANEQSSSSSSLTSAQLTAAPDVAAVADTTGLAKAVFASGCFWCTEAVFERVEGVEDVVSGYAGGTKLNPTYQEVSAGRTDYAEAVIVYYDSTEVSYPTLLELFFHSHDPTQLNRQGPDVGRQYRSAIYYNSPYQEKLTRDYFAKLQQSGEFSKPVVTEIAPLTKFWPAEAYHQDYLRLNPNDPYIRSVSMPKVKKFEKEYATYLKEEFRK